MKDLKRIFGYLGPYRKDLVFGAFLVVVETSFELIIPVLMAGIIDTGIAGGDVAYIPSARPPEAARAVSYCRRTTKAKP